MTSGPAITPRGLRRRATRPRSDVAIGFDDQGAKAFVRDPSAVAAGVVPAWQTGQSEIPSTAKYRIGKLIPVAAKQRPLVAGERDLSGPLPVASSSFSTSWTLLRRAACTAAGAGDG